MVQHTGTKVFTLEREIDASQLQWNPHPTCKGVALKHLVTSEATEGQLSCHLVRIDPGCEISEHIHAEQLELHEVLSGHGTGGLFTQDIPYASGTSVVIPAKTPHKVCADGEDALYLLAKFSPALV